MNKPIITSPVSGEADAIHRTAMQALSLGQLDHGIRLLQQALEKNPSSGAIHRDLGTACWQAGRPDDAQRHYAEAARLAPNDPYVLNNYGGFLLAQGRLEESWQLLRRAFEIKPDHYEIPNNIGLLALRKGDLKTAEDFFMRSIRLNPGWSNAHANLGTVLARTNRLPLAEQAYRHALKLNPGNGAAWQDLADACFRMNRIDEAVDATRRAVALEEDNPNAWLRLAALLESVARLDESMKVIEEAKTRFAALPAFALIEAKILRRKGSLDEARGLMERHAGMVDKDGGKAGPYYYELGDIYDRLGETDKAFAAFTVANKSLARANGAIVALAPHTSEMLRRWQREVKPPATASRPSPDRRTPVFLVGFLRSGTTLLDQILGSHPRVTSVNEERAVERCVLHLISRHGNGKGGGSGRHLENPCFPACVSELTEGQVDELRDLFWETHHELASAPGGDVLIDKNPLNMLYLPLILRMFPSAKFVLSLRHPCDAVLSFFMQAFGLNRFMARSLDIEDGARFYDEAFSLWEQHRSILKPDVHEVRYEDVVSDFRPTIAALLKFIGTEWDDSVLEYDKKAREGGWHRTPSYHQVTEKIYTRASGRWQRYRKHLEPLFPILAPWAEKYGYSMEPPKTAGE